MTTIQFEVRLSVRGLVIGAAILMALAAVLLGSLSSGSARTARAAPVTIYAVTSGPQLIDWMKRSAGTSNGR